MKFNFEQYSIVENFEVDGKTDQLHILLIVLFLTRQSLFSTLFF